jgi:hypothetical protein
VRIGANYRDIAPGDWCGKSPADLPRIKALPDHVG